MLAYWKAWALYAVLMVGYVILLVISLRTSAAHPHAPGSLNGVPRVRWGTAEGLVHCPAAVGGPWQWLPVADRSYARSPRRPRSSGLAGSSWPAVVVVSIWLRRDGLAGVG